MAAQPSVLYTVLTLAMLAIFGIDMLFAPLGVAIGVLYAALVLATWAGPHPRLPLAAAIVFSILTIAGGMFGLRWPTIPLWIGTTNRLFSLFIIWLPVLFIAQRRHAEQLLRDANEHLEERVRARTAEIAAKESALRQTQAELHALTNRLLTIQDEERRRIAHDLHDDVNQRLAMIALGLQRLDEIHAALPESTREALAMSRHDLVALSDDVRRMAYRYHPSILDDLGLDAALKRLLDEFTHKTGVKTVLVNPPFTVPPSKPHATALYRIVQECLANITRHANATRVEVELFGGEREWDLTVRDNGTGFDVATIGRESPGLGLINLRERVLAFHGTSRVQSQPGQGTEIHVQIPLENR